MPSTDAARGSVPRGRLLTKYALTLAGLVGLMLVASGLVETYFDVESQRTALAALQVEKANVAAQKIEDFILGDVERRIEWSFPSALVERRLSAEERRVALAELLARVLAITQASYADAGGAERVRVSRTSVTVMESGRDWSGEAAFREARASRSFYGPVYFREGSEPHMTVAVGEPGPSGGAIIADVSVTFVSEVASAIHVGSGGYAYVIDGRGHLIAHPDSALVLRNSDLSSLPQVGTAIGGNASPASGLGRDVLGRGVLSASAPVAVTGWYVFVEQRLEDAFASIYRTILRAGVLLLLGLAASLGASVILARKMVTPIRALRDGAALIGAGSLDHEIRVRTGDEIENLADEFNRMTGQLRQLYSGLEKKVAERTQDLVEEHRRAEELLRQKSDVYEPLLNAQSDLGEIILIAEGDRLVYSNQALGLISGRDSQSLGGIDELLDVLAPEDRTSFGEHLRASGGGAKFEAAVIRPDGARVELEVAIERYLTGGRERRVIVARDITERKKAQRALEYQALHDLLTDLPNRTLLHDRLDQAIRGARRNQAPLSLLLVDLDHFKEINDAFGHQVGDALLREVGPRFQGTLRETDTLARLGGDEFAIVLPDADSASASRVAEKLIKTLQVPFIVDGRALDISASIGIAAYPTHGADATALFRCADVAMYVAKHASEGYAVYDTKHDQHTADRLTLTADLRRSIELDHFVLHYQPLVSVRDGRVVGTEALVRWRHPTRGLVPPMEFIPLAEQTGLIRPLTRRVLEMALGETRKWRDAGHNLFVSVNLSVRSLLDPQILQTVSGAIAQAGARPEWLVLEITESVVMADPERARETLLALREMGVRLSIDDFGTGYSSLAYLRHLPVDEVKIDRSFVASISTDGNSAAIVRSTIDLGHDLGFEIVAEGVEDAIVQQHLDQLGCDLAQGYFIARPMPATELSRWLESRGSSPSLTLASA